MEVDLTVFSVSEKNQKTFHENSFYFINFLQCVWKVQKMCYIDGSNFDENGFYFINFLQCVWKVKKKFHDNGFYFINFLQYVWKVEKTCYVNRSNFHENGFYFINFLQCVWKVQLCLQLALIVPTIDINCKLSFSYFINS